MDVPDGSNMGQRQEKALQGTTGRKPSQAQSLH